MNRDDLLRNLIHLRLEFEGAHVAVLDGEGSWGLAYEFLMKTERGNAPRKIGPLTARWRRWSKYLNIPSFDMTHSETGKRVSLRYLPVACDLVMNGDTSTGLQVVGVKACLNELCALCGLGQSTEPESPTPVRLDAPEDPAAWARHRAAHLTAMRAVSCCTKETRIAWIDAMIAVLEVEGAALRGDDAGQGAVMLAAQKLEELRVLQLQAQGVE